MLLVVLLYYLKLKSPLGIGLFIGRGGTRDLLSLIGAHVLLAASALYVDRNFLCCGSVHFARRGLIFCCFFSLVFNLGGCCLQVLDHLWRQVGGGLIELMMLQLLLFLVGHAHRLLEGRKRSLFY